MSKLGKILGTVAIVGAGVGLAAYCISKVKKANECDPFDCEDDDWDDDFVDDDIFEDDMNEPTPEELFMLQVGVSRKEALEQIISCPDNTLAQDVLINMDYSQLAETYTKLFKEQ